MALLTDDDELVLQPIDLESLVLVDVSFPLVEGTFDLQYDNIEKGDEAEDWMALRYVWWQIFLVAVAWFHEKRQDELKAQPVIAAGSDDIQNERPVDVELQWFNDDFWRGARELPKELVDDDSFGTRDAITQLLQWVSPLLASGDASKASVSL